MGCAEVISFDEVRARKHWTTLRQRLHERFDQWLDRLESALPAGEPTLGQVSATIWALRQQRTGGVAETIVPHTHHEEQRRQQMPCPTCARLLPARGPVPRCVETMVGPVDVWCAMAPNGSGNTCRRCSSRRVRCSTITTVRSTSTRWPKRNTRIPYARRNGPRRPSPGCIWAKWGKCSEVCGGCSPRLMKH